MNFKQIATEWNDEWLVKFLIGTSKLLSAGTISKSGGNTLADYALNSHRKQQEIIDLL